MQRFFLLPGYFKELICEKKYKENIITSYSMSKQVIQIILVRRFTLDKALFSSLFDIDWQFLVLGTLLVNSADEKSQETH